MFSLKFISGKYQGGEFPLTPGKQLIIGRSPDLELALVEDMVSRKHAKLTVTDDGRITIEDLGSSNGTFVNGEQIAKPVRLKDGDRILIGTSILKLVKLDAAQVQAQGGKGTTRLATLKPNLETVAKVASQRKTHLTSVTGRIEELAVADLLQLFGTSRKNGVLCLRRDDGEEARIYLRQGRIYYAQMSSAPGCGPQKSFRRILRWKSGDFELLPPDTTRFDDELDESTDQLLLGAHHEIDEITRLQEKLPFTTKIRPVRPLEKPLRSLTPQLLDTFQLIYNHIGTVQQALDYARHSDFETAQAIVELLEAGYLQKA